MVHAQLDVIRLHAKMANNIFGLDWFVYEYVISEGGHSACLPALGILSWLVRCRLRRLADPTPICSESMTCDSDDK